MKISPFAKKTIGVFLVVAGITLLAYDAYLRVNTMGTGGMTIGGMIGAACLIAGGILVISSRYVHDPQSGSFGRTRNYTSEPEIRIPPEGFVTAVIIGITKSLRMPGEKEGFHVICRYTEKETGVEKSFTSEKIGTYPGQQIIGKKVRVYFDNGDTEQYRVDLNSIG